ncbi:flagellar hook-associated protein FlgK [bacterium]|nr:flagellar hook-associated protein FlgK [bacterium]
MASTFFGISVAQSGLTAQKRAMEVLSYNIANANDPTYKRQKVVMVEGQVLATSQEASSVGSSGIGSGTQTGDVERVVDALVENRLRETTTNSAEWDYMASTLSGLESIMNEPSDSSLETDLDTFWNSWSTVANSADDTSVRSALLEDATSLCERIQYVYGQMSDMVDDLNLEAEDIVDQINLMAKEIGALNNQIGAMSSNNEPVNDLLNTRDALVSELAGYVDVTVSGEGSGDLVISIAGRVLVQGSEVNTLTTVTGSNGESSIVWEDGLDPVAVTGGELKAVTDLRDTVIPGYMSQLDDIAAELVSSVNALHQTGLTLDGSAGGDFFKAGTTAANICLDESIVGKPDLIAASSSTNFGKSNGNIAQAIADLKDAEGTSINEMYETLVGNIGSASAAAQTQSEAYALSLEQLTTQQQSVSGVSLDEELTNMIKFQQAYNAASRVLTVMNDMLDVLMQTG